MKLSSLQGYLKSLVGPLQASGASGKIIKDIEETCTELQHFADWELSQLGVAVRELQEYKISGVWPGVAKKRTTTRQPAKPKHDPDVVMEFAQKVRALEERAAAQETTREEIREGLANLNLDKLSKDNLVAIAQELSRPATSKTNKKQAIDMIRRLVLERKEVVEGALT